MGDKRVLEDVLPGGPPEHWILPIGSLVEPMLALVTLRFEEQGRLSLSDPIERYLPEFAVLRVHVGEGSDGEEPRTRPASVAITVEHLITHRSGIPLLPSPYTSAFDHPSVAPRSLRPTLEAFARRTGTEDLRGYAGRLASLPLRSEPGGERLLGESYTVLGALLEVIAGKPLTTILAEQIFDPLGMTDTAFCVPESKRERLVPLLLYFGPFAVPPVSVDIFGTDATPTADPPALEVRNGCYSSAADLLRFAECLAGKGERAGVRILSISSFERGFERDLLGEAWPEGEGVEPGATRCGLFYDPPWYRSSTASRLLVRFDEPFAAVVLWFLHPTGNCRGYLGPWLGVSRPE